jgi:hypothetical protein
MPTRTTLTDGGSGRWRLTLFRAPVVLACMLVLVALGASSASPSGQAAPWFANRPTAPPRVAAASRPYVFPLKVSANRRYLVDRHNTPFMIVGDSPQALIANLSPKDAAAYLRNRKAAGFDALWVHLLCATYTGCRSDGTTFDGIKPFTEDKDLARPNPAYFRRAATMLRLAQRAGIVVFLDPIETGGWLDVLRSNGVAKDRGYGRFVGRRFRSFHNIVWSSGNDFQTWRNPADDTLVRAVASGIRATDPTAVQTLELDYPVSASRDDVRWQRLVKLDGAYTYSATYAEVLREYNRKPPLPVFLVEAGYEFEQNAPSISYGDPETLRRQEYWSMLAGASGQFYGNHYTWAFRPHWKERLDTVGSAQVTYLVDLFGRLRWYRLVPDQAHRIVTGGYGTFAGDANVASSDYVTTAVTPDRRLAISYLPRGGTIQVDMRRMAGPVRARWYDPTDGRYSTVQGSPFSTKLKRLLAAPPHNAEGASDWVLVLTVS